MLATLGEGAFGRVVKVKDVTQSRYIEAVAALYFICSRLNAYSVCFVYPSMLNYHRDDKSNYFALKILKNIGRYIEEAKLEIGVLETLGRIDPDGK